MSKRLNVYIARATGLSRRAADRAVQEGRVKVNSEVVCEPGRQVETADKVEFEGSEVSLPEKFTWLIMDKPRGYITTRSDESGRNTVMELLPKHLHNLFPVGRLDRDSEGVLIFTNDGKTAHKMLHPSFEIERTYRVVLDKELSDNDFKLAKRGVLLEGKRATPVELNRAGKPFGHAVYHITLTEGRYHEVKRLFAALGREVLKLRRLSHAGITSRGLKAGDWRILSDEEIEKLKSRLERKVE